MQVTGSQLEQNLANTQMKTQIAEKNNQNIVTNENETIKQQNSFGKTEQENQLIKLIEDSNETIQDDKNEFQFSVHAQTKQILIKVVDKQTKEVIKEFPPEKILDMIAKMCEIAGVFVDEKR